MTIKKNILTDEDVVRIARISAVPAAAGAFKQTTYDTNLTIERGVIWLILFIEFHASPATWDNTIAAGSEETEKFQVTAASETVIKGADDNDVVCQYAQHRKRSAAIGAEVGPMWYVTDWPYVRNFARPLPYAGTSIYFGYQGSDVTGIGGICRIGYVIKNVSDAFFFRIAQAML